MTTMSVFSGPGAIVTAGACSSDATVAAGECRS